jgi:hypothetical protein
MRRCFRIGQGAFDDSRFAHIRERTATAVVTGADGTNANSLSGRRICGPFRLRWMREAVRTHSTRPGAFCAAGAMVVCDMSTSAARI